MEKNEPKKNMPKKKTPKKSTPPKRSNLNVTRLVYNRLADLNQLDQDTMKNIWESVELHSSKERQVQRHKYLAMYMATPGFNGTIHFTAPALDPYGQQVVTLLQEAEKEKGLSQQQDELRRNLQEVRQKEEALRREVEEHEHEMSKTDHILHMFLDGVFGVYLLSE